MSKKWDEDKDNLNYKETRICHLLEAYGVKREDAVFLSKQIKCIYTESPI